VRAGSHVTNPDSIDLDSGEKLKWEIISGKQAKERKLPVTEQITDDSEIVVTYLARPLAAGTTNRIRLMETYADPKSYFMDGEDFEGQIAQSMEETLTKAHTESFDLYVLDKRLPDGSGTDLCRMLNAGTPGVPCIFYSGDTYELHRQEAFAAGARAYVSKPD